MRKAGSEMISKQLLIAIVALTALNIGACLVVLSTATRAEVAGMSFNELARDRDFRRAVESIVVGCTVNRSSISC